MKMKRILAVLSAVAMLLCSVSVFAEGTTKTIYGSVTDQNYTDTFKIYDAKVSSTECKDTYVEKRVINRGNEENPDYAVQYGFKNGEKVTKNNAINDGRVPYLKIDSTAATIEKGKWAHISFDFMGEGYGNPAGAQVAATLEWTGTDTSGNTVTKMDNNASVGFQTLVYENQPDAKKSSKTIQLFNGYSDEFDNSWKPETPVTVDDSGTVNWHTYDCYFGGPNGNQFVICMDGKIVSSGTTKPRQKAIDGYENKYISGVGNLYVMSGTSGNYNSGKISAPRWSNYIIKWDSTTEYTFPETGDLFRASIDNIAVNQVDAAPCLGITVLNNTATATLDLNAGVAVPVGSTILLASYVDGKLADVDITEVSGTTENKITATLTGVATGTVVKARVFNSLAGMKPLMGAVEKTAE